VDQGVNEDCTHLFFVDDPNGSFSRTELFDSDKGSLLVEFQIVLFVFNPIVDFKASHLPFI
jgi:hypothetical protein